MHLIPKSTHYSLQEWREDDDTVGTGWYVHMVYAHYIQARNALKLFKKDIPKMMLFRVTTERTLLGDDFAELDSSYLLDGVWS